MLGLWTCCAIPELFIIIGCPICDPVAIIGGGGLAWLIRGVCIAARPIGVACPPILGVLFGIRGVPDGWLCWLPRPDMLCDIGADIGW
jgi:hypothetical protein